MKTTLFIAGMLVTLMGLVWAAQGAGLFPYPRESFMIDQRPWIYIGLLTAFAGALTMYVSRRLR
jgi:hypothetical protein